MKHEKTAEEIFFAVETIVIIAFLIVGLFYMIHFQKCVHACLLEVVLTIVCKAMDLLLDSAQQILAKLPLY